MRKVSLQKQMNLKILNHENKNLTACSAQYLPPPVFGELTVLFLKTDNSNIRVKSFDDLWERFATPPVFR
jgi:hypothetical protein